MTTHTPSVFPSGTAADQLGPALSGKVCIITGGSSGIGLETARLFAQHGARLCLFARGEQALAAARRELGAEVLTVRGDVRRLEDLRTLYRETRERLGAVDVLVASAALVKLAPLEHTESGMVEDVLATNLSGALATLREALPVLAPGAAVIFATSWLAHTGFAGASALAMSKAGVRALVRVAANELAAQNIRVNAVCPGAIETPLWGKLGLSDSELREAGAALTAKIPLRRWGHPRELARAVLFLASPAASYITGAELAADGGIGQV